MKRFMFVLAVLVVFVLVPFLSSSAFAAPPALETAKMHIWSGHGDISMTKDPGETSYRSQNFGVDSYGSSYFDNASIIEIYACHNHDNAPGDTLYCGKMNKSVVYGLLNGKQGTAVVFAYGKGEGEGFEETIVRAIVVVWLP